MPARRVIGADLATRYPDLYPERPGPVITCIVCGTTDCRIEAHVDESIVSRPGARHRSPSATDRRDKAQPVPEGFTQDPKDVDIIVANDDVYIEHYPRGTTRPSTIMLVHAGQRMTREALDTRLAVYNKAPLETK